MAFILLDYVKYAKQNNFVIYIIAYKQYENLSICKFNFIFEIFKQLKVRKGEITGNIFQTKREFYIRILTKIFYIGYRFFKKVSLLE